MTNPTVLNPPKKWGQVWADFLLLLFFMLGTTLLYGQNQKDSTEFDKDWFIAAYPLVFYLPETRWGFAGAAVMTFEMENSRQLKSQALLGGAYTLNKQILSYMTYTLYWGENQVDGELGYYDYYYPYYGVGPRTRLNDVENYYVRFPRVRAKYFRQLTHNLYAGGQIHYDHYDIYDVEEGGLIERNQSQFKEGGNILGLGINLQKDSRDHIFFPTRGQLMELNVVGYDRAWGSDFNFLKSHVSVSDYRTITEGHYLVTNLYLSSTFGDVPFQELSLYGGPELARGYVEGRYRDRTMAMIQLEYRFPICWRFRGVAFTSLGNVGPDVNILFSQIKFNYGAGLRFLLSKEDQIFLRLDYGRSLEGGEFYLTIGEAF